MDTFGAWAGVLLPNFYSRNRIDILENFFSSGKKIKVTRLPLVQKKIQIETEIETGSEEKEGGG